MDHPTATVNTRKGCQLCREARAILPRYGFQAELTDIDANPLLREHYNHCVPVVEIDGREHFRGRIDEGLLRRLKSG